MSGDIPSFSKRIGIESSEKKIQLEEMDEDLENSLWNAITEYYLSKTIEYRFEKSSVSYKIFSNIWRNFLKIPLDEMPDAGYEVKRILKEYYYNSPWNKKYEFIEFLVQYGIIAKIELVKGCNEILKREFSGYRFVGDILTPITSKEEIAEITEALTSPLQPITEHLTASLGFLSDKKNPDYRNSIKESISAVEFLCKKIVNNKDTTLGVALSEMQKTGIVSIHPDMNEAFKKLYHYTSDSGGIRHAMMDYSTVDFDDAKYMLVTCSAFVNYLISKSSKAGIKLK